MKIRYSVSLWNFNHYCQPVDFEKVLPLCREMGYGIELWHRCPGHTGLFDKPGRDMLKPLLKGLAVTLHTNGPRSLDAHRALIDAAADLGGEAIVLHPPDIGNKEANSVNVELAAGALDYARRSGVKLVLENGPLKFLKEALRQIPDLDICIDTGHIYLGAQRMAEYLDALKHRLTHPHLQDICSPLEAHGASFQDHYLPGTGGIPAEDWKLLRRTLEEIDFDGIAVFEIRPRDPFQNAFQGKKFFESR